MVKKFKSDKSTYVNSITTGDETWFCYHDVPSKSRIKFGYLKPKREKKEKRKNDCA